MRSELYAILYCVVFIQLSVKCLINILNELNVTDFHVEELLSKFQYL